MLSGNFTESKPLLSEQSWLTAQAVWFLGISNSSDMPSGNVSNSFKEEKAVLLDLKLDIKHNT